MLYLKIVATLNNPLSYKVTPKVVFSEKDPGNDSGRLLFFLTQIVCTLNYTNYEYNISN